MKIYLEIRPAEGGDDAKLLTKEQANIYFNYAKLNGISVKEVTKDSL